VNSFLVQIDNDPFMYLTELRNGEPFGSKYPTHGAQFNYTAANELVQYLRTRGYAVACVTDLYGQPPSVEDLASMKHTPPASEENEKSAE
jgi:hypothetical protein